MNSRNKDVVSSFFSLLFAIYAAFESYGFGLGNLYMPGPGYFPFTAASVFGLIAIVLLWQSLRKEANEETHVPPAKGHLRNVSLTLAAMIVYASVLNTVGFVLCTLFFALFFMRAIASQRWFSSMIVSLCVSLGGHVFFNVLLGAQLPVGILTWLGG